MWIVLHRSLFMLSKKQSHRKGVRPSRNSFASCMQAGLCARQTATITWRSADPPWYCLPGWMPFRQCPTPTLAGADVLSQLAVMVEQIVGVLVSNVLHNPCEIKPHWA